MEKNLALSWIFYFIYFDAEDFYNLHLPFSNTSITLLTFSTNKLILVKNFESSSL